MPLTGICVGLGPVTRDRDGLARRYLAAEKHRKQEAFSLLAREQNSDLALCVCRSNKATALCSLPGDGNTH
jgi:hypothetical protein